jgi:endogenous inhibitor of DNA gyrase (YacG/DUF329 family)
VTAGPLSTSIFEDVAPRWAVEVEGHHLVGKGRDRVITGVSTAERPELRCYPLVDVPGLFRTFAILEPTDESFLRFADQFGLLGLDHVPVEGGHKNAVGERLVDWRGAHRQLTAAVRLWDALQDGDVSELLHSTHQGERVRWLFRLDPQESLVAVMELHESHPPAAARRFLQSWINDSLESHVGVRVLWHPARRKYVPRVLPLTLFGHLWWQLARALTGEVAFVECKTCHKPIEHGPDGFMATREFCSPACKQKDHRRRVKQAKELKSKGWTVSRIARKLQTEPDAIRNWLTKKK